MFTNGTVSLLCGLTEIRYNIRRIKPYKYDTKAEDPNSKICLMMSAYDLQLYTFVLTIKAWKKVYNWIITDTLTLSHLGRAREVFHDDSILFTIGCAFRNR